MMDLSDGLAADLPKLATASGCGAIIDEIPVSEGVDAVAEAADVDPLYWALNGGEDYELLIAVAPRSYEALARSFRFRFGRDLRSIGYCTAEKGVRISTPAGIVGLEAIGWDHFAAEETPSPTGKVPAADSAPEPSAANPASSQSEMLHIQVAEAAIQKTAALPSADILIAAPTVLPPESAAPAPQATVEEMGAMAQTPSLPTAEAEPEPAPGPPKSLAFEPKAESEANSFD
jgi:hypothetical protein